MRHECSGMTATVAGIEFLWGELDHESKATLFGTGMYSSFEGSDRWGGGGQIFGGGGQLLHGVFT